MRGGRVDIICIDGARGAGSGQGNVRVGGGRSANDGSSWFAGNDRDESRRQVMRKATADAPSAIHCQPCSVRPTFIDVRRTCVVVFRKMSLIRRTRYPRLSGCCGVSLEEPSWAECPRPQGYIRHCSPHANTPQQEVLWRHVARCCMSRLSDQSERSLTFCTPFFRGPGRVRHCSALCPSSACASPNRYEAFDLCTHLSSPCFKGFALMLIACLASSIVSSPRPEARRVPWDEQVK